MSGIHKASVFGDFKELWVCITAFSSSSFIWSDLDSSDGGCGQHAVWGSVMCLMTRRQRVWGKGHLG